MERKPTSDEVSEREAVQPTEHDRANERIRREIAERQAQAYGQVLAWALGAFGPGWEPSHRHFLVSKEEEERVRYFEERPTAAKIVYTVKNADGRARHFTVEDGRVVEYETVEAGFGSMLLEPHESRGFEYNGKWHRTHKFSLCWAPFDLYEPKAAEELAKLRESRVRKKAEREDIAFAQKYPLLAKAGIRREDLE